MYCAITLVLAEEEECYWASLPYDGWQVGGQWLAARNKMFSLEFEAGFIRLLDKLTNGSRIEVNETGNSILLA